MAYNGSFLWVVASAADQTTYAGTGRLRTIGGTVYLSFPMKYLARKGYDCRPKQREELKAYRDDNTRNLTRVTATGLKSSMTLKTLGGLHDAEKREILAWFTSHESDALQRKISLYYYESDSGNYETGNFYRSNSAYTVITTTETDIIWDTIEIELVQY